METPTVPHLLLQTETRDPVLSLTQNLRKKNKDKNIKTSVFLLCKGRQMYPDVDKWTHERDSGRRVMPARAVRMCPVWQGHE